MVWWFRQTHAHTNNIITSALLQRVFAGFVQMSDWNKIYICSFFCVLHVCTVCLDLYMCALYRGAINPTFLPSFSDIKYALPSKTRSSFSALWILAFSPSGKISSYMRSLNMLTHLADPRMHVLSHNLMYTQISLDKTRNNYWKCIIVVFPGSWPHIQTQVVH